MNSPQLESAAVQKLTAFIQAKKLTRIQTAGAALALLTVLYIGLWIGLDRADTVSAQEPPPAATTGAAAATPTADEESLSASFLGEYDRLAGASPSSQSGEQAESVAAPDTPLNTVFFSLLLVAGMAYAGVWGYKQVLVRRQGLPVSTGGKRLSVQETQPLGPNQQLHLVRLGDEVLLLGATEHTITCLARYDADYAEDSFDAQLAAATGKAKPAASTPKPLSLQESLDSLRNVQHRPRGGDHA